MTRGLRSSSPLSQSSGATEWHCYYYYYYYHHHHHHHHHHSSSLIVIPYYIILSPAVIERKAGPAVITRPTKHTLEFARMRVIGILTQFPRVSGGCGDGRIAATVPRGCGDISAHRNTAVMATVSREFVGAVRLFVRNPDYNLTRNSTIADKPHDAFAQYAITWLPPPPKKKKKKTRPSPFGIGPS